MSDNRSIATGVLVEAARTVGYKRPGVHGSAENSFQMIAEMWELYLRHQMIAKNTVELVITPTDVSQMMSLLKKARFVYGDAQNPDNFVDDAGYTSLAGMLVLPENHEIGKQKGDDFTGGKTKVDPKTAPPAPKLRLKDEELKES